MLIYVNFSGDVKRKRPRLRIAEVHRHAQAQDRRPRLVDVLDPVPPPDGRRQMPQGSRQKKSSHACNVIACLRPQLQ